MSDYADEIAERICAQLLADSPSRRWLKTALAQAAREGYALGYAAAGGK